VGERVYHVEDAWEAGRLAGVGGPLDGLRVLELTRDQPGRLAGMLLADLGADVVRVVSPGWRPATPQESAAPEDLVWDRGKRFVALPHDGRTTGGRDVPAPAAMDGLARRASLVIDDLPAGVAAPAAEAPGLVNLRMPPHGHTGRWRDLPADPLLTAALGGFAAYHPSHEPGSPVASVVPMLASVHGAIGAATAVAGMFGALMTGHGRVLEVSGLHAAAACLATLVVEGVDVDGISAPDGTINARPYFRTYRCADGLYLHLSALTPEFFLPALVALDRTDVMATPGVDGEFTHLFSRPGIGRAVGQELERTFAERRRDEWLALLADAGVPCAPVHTRDEWLEGEILAAAAPPVVRPHPVVGRVLLPGVPVELSDTPGAVGPLPDADRFVDAVQLWTEPARPRPAPTGPAPTLPLAGLRVIDLSTFLSAPFATALMADLGAAVVKIESPGGDPYRVYAASYAAVNHGKTAATVDLRSDAGRTCLHRLADEADVLVDNLRPGSATRLGLDERGRFDPGLVRLSVSAYGRSGAYAEVPGFDPVMQSWSGLAAAQGGADEPITTSAPTVDVGTGALGALGVLAALVARIRTGRGQHVTASLAASATYLQVAELASYPGRPPVAVGGREHRGPRPARRYHRASDGWVAVAATTPEQEAAVAALLGLEALSHEAVATALAECRAEHWVAELARCGVPACVVAPRAGLFADPYLVSNDFTHVVRDPEFGRLRLVRGYVRTGSATGRPGSWPQADVLLGAVGTVRERYEIVPDDRAQ
jgi:crotonobetainyl-CoA:carnitine CoA-transferase CaiB-like acyl-CoA transferase